MPEEEKEPLPEEEAELEEETKDESGIDVEKTSLEELREVIAKKDRQGLLSIFERVPTIDIAEAADDLEPTELIYIFRNVESSWTADFFDDLTQDTKERLVQAMTDKDLVKLINSQATDDIVDTVGDMPANLASRVLKAADKEMRADINALLKYKDGTAGALMTTDYIELIGSLSVEAAMKAIRERGKDAETIYTIFVRNRQREFVGTVDLDDLIFADPQDKLDDIMNSDVVSVQATTDQEEVGQIFRRYDLNALAVLNDDDRLVGVITIDDAVDVMTEESSEDMARMSNMEPTEKPYLELSPWENAMKCIPWIMALLVLGTFTTMVLNRLESKAIFTNLPILIAFVPMLMDTGGNAGGQTTGLMIRSLALKEFSPRDIHRVLWREFRSALVVAAVIASFSFIWLLIEQYTGIVELGVLGEGTGSRVDLSGMNIWKGNCWNWEFGYHALINAGLIGVTMFAAVTVAKLVGTLLPIGAAAIKKDPALLSQPLLTTVMDVTTLMIYWAVAMAFFPQFAS